RRAERIIGPSVPLRRRGKRALDRPLGGGPSRGRGVAEVSIQGLPPTRRALHDHGSCRVLWAAPVSRPPARTKAVEQRWTTNPRSPIQLPRRRPATASPAS